MSISKRSLLILDAIQIALADLAKVPDCDEKRDLETRLNACGALVGKWKTVPPTPDEREATMQVVLTLHVAVTKLRRDTSLPQSS
jgi:hypothetical protein